MSDIEIDFSDENLSIDMGSDVGEDKFRIESKKKSTARNKTT